MDLMVNNNAEISALGSVLEEIVAKTILAISRIKILLAVIATELNKQQIIEKAEIEK